MLPSKVTSPYSRSVESVLTELQTSKRGLTIEQVESRLATYGYNQLPPPHHTPYLYILLRQFSDPLVYVLLIAAFISLVIGELRDATFIFGVLLLNAMIGSFQERSAQISASSLQSLITHLARVVRDGESYEIEAAQLVPGDIVLLESGDKVPADLRLLTAMELGIDESLLTGESLPVNKSVDARLGQNTLLAEQTNMAFSGTLVTRGRALGVVTATGTSTELGKIAEEITGYESARPPLLQRLDRFTIRLTIVMSVITLGLGFITLYQGMPWFEVFLFMVAFAVAAIPEGLPVAITIAMSISIRRMAKRHVIARRLVTVESLGSCTYIASDKTGTLTRNELSVQKVVLPGHDEIDFPARALHPHETILPELQSLSETTLNDLVPLAQTMALANEGFVGKRNGDWVHHGDSMDVALLTMAHHLGLAQPALQVDFPLIASIPFESASRFSASLHNEQGNRLVCVKGAIETLLPMCDHVVIDDNHQLLDVDVINQQAHQLAERGYRVLAAASGYIDSSHNTLSSSDLRGMRFLGMVGVIDPLRDESKQAIADCHRAGIKVIMLTGDHPVTAFAIGQQLGLVDDLSQVVTSSELVAIQHDVAAYEKLILQKKVFARLEPRQKLDIVQVLQKQGHYVAVTGDGANDAPALRAAHVGVAMGKAGTDVARETADIIVTDDNFSSIVAGVEEGRIAYSNVRKVVHLLISTGAGEIVLFFLSLMTGLPIPLTAIQLLWLNLVTNGIQDVALAFEPGEGHELLNPPRNPREAIFNRVMIQRVILAALVIGGVAFVTFYSLLSQGMMVEEARNSTLLLMVLFENMHIFNSRSETRSVFSLNPFSNMFLLWSIIGAQLVHIGAMYVPALSHILQISPVNLSQWLYYLLLAMTLILASEVYKWLRSNKLIDPASS